MNNQTQQQTNQVPKKDTMDLEFKNPIEFRGQHGLQVTTTQTLYKYVNKLFKALPEFEGSIIDVNPATGAIQCSLFFHAPQQVSEYSVVQTSDQANKTANSALDKYNRMNLRSQNRKLFLTDFGKELLFRYILKNSSYKDPSKFNWNNITCEQYDQQQYGNNGVALLKVSNIDLCKIIPKFYTNPNNTYFQWNVGIMRPVGAMNGIGVMNYMVKVERIDTGAVDELYKELGFLAVSGSLPIVRE